MRRVLVRTSMIAVLASACTFSIQLDPSSDGPAPDDAPSADAPADSGPIDATLPVDAGPDAMPAWVQIETITVPCDGSELLSVNLLAANTTYRLRATGQCTTNDSNNSRGDAEFAYNQFSNGSSSSGIDMGLAINDTTPDAVKLPNWGAYQSSHNYSTMWMGLGARIVVKFHDPNYENNGGELTLHVDAYQ